MFSEVFSAERSSEATPAVNQSGADFVVTIVHPPQSEKSIWPNILRDSSEDETERSHSGYDTPARLKSEGGLEGNAAAKSWGMVLAILGTFLFALKSIFIKLAFAEGTDATFLLTIRMVFALPFYVGVLWMLRRSEDRKPLERGVVVRALGLGFLGYYLASYLDLSGLEQISAQLERLTLFTYPALVAALAWMFLGEHVSVRIVLAIVLSYAGVWLMYGQERKLTGDGNTTLGVLLVMGAAISYSLYVLFAKPTSSESAVDNLPAWR